jgi:hypothetical protein
MKRLLKINFKRIFIFLGLVVVIFLAECGLKALTVDVPKSGNANEISTFVLHCGAEPRINTSVPPANYTTRLIIGMLVPKDWHAAENTVVTFTSPKGNGTMSVIPAAEKESVSGLSWSDAAKKRFGIGPNLLDDMEWIVYRSVATYTFVNNEDIDFDVTVKSKLGPQNMLVKLGFFCGSSKEGLRPDDTDYTKLAYSNAFSVVNGTGDIVDFVNPQLGKVDPLKSLDNDLITLTFDAGVLETNLSNTDDIYLCVKTFTSTGESIDVCEQTAKTKLTSIGGKKYRIDLWPRGFFNVPKGKTLTRLEYYYTNANGSVKIGYGNTADPFKYTFNCQ